MGFGQHFFDSGAFTLEKAARKWAKETGRSKWDYFSLPEAFAFLDSYVEFIDEHQSGLDFYANVDAIGNPDITYKNQKYLEDKGLNPVPVVHFGTDVQWLERYIEEGYDYIALGGLVGKTGKKSTRLWIDRCFDCVCDSNGIPQSKLHGFGVTSFALMRLYPWYSVDSTSWIRCSSYGNIYIPRKTNGDWDFTRSPLVLTVSKKSSGSRKGDYHVLTASKAVKVMVDQWLEHVGTSLDAVTSDRGFRFRTLANVRYFREFCKCIPEWPWKWSKLCKAVANSRFGV